MNVSLPSHPSPASKKYLSTRATIRKVSHDPTKAAMAAHMAELEEENKRLGKANEELRTSAALNSWTVETLQEANEDLLARCNYFESIIEGPPTIPPVLISPKFYDKLQNLASKLEQCKNNQGFSPATKEAFLVSSELAKWSLRQHHFFLGVMQELRRQIPERYEQIIRAVHRTVSKPMQETASAPPPAEAITFSEVPQFSFFPTLSDFTLQDPDKVLGWEHPSSS